MDESALVGSQMAKAIAPGMFSSLGIWVKGGQDRKNLEADRTVVEGMLQRGLTNFRYSGIEMDFEHFDDTQQEEIKRLVDNTVSAAMKADSVVDWSKVDLGQFSPEFRRRWIMETSNVSDETLQELWARLLAGELESPGSVSNDTMSIARDLTKERAEEFQILCSSALHGPDETPTIVVGCGSPGSNSLSSFGLSYDVLMRLAHHRLIVNDMNTYIDLAVDSSRLMVAQHQKSRWLLRWSGNKEQVRIMGILFTPAGKELFAVVEKVPVPAYTEAMLTALKQEGCIMSPLPKES